MEQETHKEYHREGVSVRRNFGEALPSEDVIRAWPTEAAAYHILDTIKRMQALLKIVRDRGRKRDWLYDVNQQLALCRMIKGEKALLHEIIHPMTH